MIAQRIGQGKIGCLLIHGFGGTPNEVYPLAEFLASNGYCVYISQLPGHETETHHNYIVSWRDWLNSIQEDCKELQSKVERIVVIGHSTGAILGLLSANLPLIIGIVAIAPISHIKPWQLALFRVIKPFTRYIPLRILVPEINEKTEKFKPIQVGLIIQLIDFLDHARKVISAITVPVLILFGGKDHTVPRNSTLQLVKMLYSTKVEIQFYPLKDHMLMLGEGKEKVWNRTMMFIKNLQGE